MPRPAYMVTVGNIGTVHECANEKEARKVFNDYIDLSIQGYGRAAGESVTLWRNGDIVEEHYEPSLDDIKESLQDLADTK